MASKYIKENVTLPMISLKDTCMFPSTNLTLELDNESSKRAVQMALSEDSIIFLVKQINPAAENVSDAEVEPVGTVCSVTECFEYPDGRLRVSVRGVIRAIVTEIYQKNDSLANVTTLEDKGNSYGKTKEFEAVKSIVIDNIRGSQMGLQIGANTLENIEAFAEGHDFIYAVSSALSIPAKEKQKILEESDLEKRADILLHVTNAALEISEITERIAMKVHENFGKQQKEAFIREEIELLKEELGDDDESEIKRYRQTVAKLKLSDENREKLEKDITRLERMNPMLADNQVLRSYLDYVLELPWGVKTEESNDIEKARKILERDHYGMKKVKERILEYLAVRDCKKDGKDPIICLFGPPGVGKTSIVKSVAEAMNKKYVRMSLGGVHDEAEIRGHRKTYVGAMPGRVIAAIKQAGTSNPLILLDEVDKLGKDMRGDPGAALLEVLDGEQNVSFRDHYIEMPFDLSGVTFITTANDLDAVPEPLRDRMEIIEITGYSEDEKLEIAKRHLIPKQLKAHGMTKSAIKFSDTMIKYLIWNYTAESGVRQLEREIAAIIRKSVLAMKESKAKSITINKELLEKYLGPSKRYDEEYKKENQVGVAGGLAWTAVGGVTLSVEVNTFPGTGKIELTGSLGDVMKESAHIALSYMRSKTKTLGISETFYKDTDIHIHVPEGATPKDGPSAGITMATALVSAFTNKKVRHDVAMTGEITLRGNVLPIGGLKEKSLAAARKGVKTLIIPETNKRDAEEIPDAVKKKLKIVYVKTIEQVLDVALVK